MPAKQRALVGCSGKLRFATSSAADARVRELRQQQSRKRGSTLGVYECRHCTFFHIGHSSWGARA